MKLRKRLVAVGLAVSVVAAACGSDDTGSDTTTTVPPQPTTTTTVPESTDDMMDMVLTGTDATESGAAALRSLLTAQLQEHVYLAGIAVYTAVNQPEAFDAAAGALDLNSQDLAASIGSVYGDAAGEAFLELWRTHIGFFVDYTGARAAGDQAGQDAAREGLSQYREDFGAFIESANPNLPKEAVIEELQPHVMTVFAAIDAVVDGDADAFEKLKIAANVMPD
ncbi:MAG: hypothetical protein HKN74_04715, partial [Acidimicrobiia bacterium]|nr:hypothetical protein [Acidimicrobiia bacterium]NNL71505.1 hypothetical protein [Acidimicrobiia bacterium]